MFVPHPERTALPLERATSKQCTEKLWLFTVRITGNAYTKCVCGINAYFLHLSASGRSTNH